MRLIRQLEGGEVYKTLIERDLATLNAPVHPTHPSHLSHPFPPTRLSCGTVNDADARFCKQCGKSLA